MLLMNLLSMAGKQHTHNEIQGDYSYENYIRKNCKFCCGIKKDGFIGFIIKNSL